MIFGQISQRPYITSFHQSQYMESLNGFTIPIQIRQYKKSFSEILITTLPVHDIFLLCLAVNDVKHPVQSAFFSLLFHVRSYLVRISLGCLRNHMELLRRVLGDVLFRTWPNEVNFQ